MKAQITPQIEHINRSLAWIKANRPNEYRQRFLQLVQARRTLKKILAAASNNPGIAAFGKSQVGKSYLISCLLQGRDQDGKDVPFMVSAGERKYNFVYKINPPSEEGGGRESTGVVSRFSSLRRDPSLYNPDFPVLVKTFSVTDIILILADSYFNDFGDYTTLGESEIQELCRQWDETYGNKRENVQEVMCADDILNIKSYFEKHVNNAQAFNRSPMFDRLALLIDRIPVDDFADVFSNLWNKEECFTALFLRLLEILQTFRFSATLHLPIEAVLHEGIRENTIMSVQCLKQFFESDSPYRTDVYVRTDDNRYEKCASQMPKSEICAICSEVVYKIDAAFLQSARPYQWQNMDPQVGRLVTHDEVKMEMLAENDLLDFPGARAREQEELKKLSKANILDFFLRGKVAYLFNKYNEEMGINILLYCHHNKDNDVTGLYKLLEDWVNNYVGSDCEKRREKLNETKVSPLFYIGTMFNLDLEMGKGTEMTPKSIDQRWIGRFDTVVNKQCFHRLTADWVKNWTAPGEDFNNSYLLRDYKFSGKLYSGFEEEGRETGTRMSEEYFQMMRTTFIENEHVKRLFARPEVSWDVAATRENDGALYIIENLTEVASRMNQSRENDFARTLLAVRQQVYDTIKVYHVSENLDELLAAHIRKAKEIFREMDFTCNTDNYFFGHLIQALQTTEKESYRAVHSVMQSTLLNSVVNDFKDYEIIRSSCKNQGHPIEEATTDAEKWRCVMATYGFESEDEANAFLQRKHIDKNQLFSGSYKRKKNSCIIADALFNNWCEHIQSVDFLHTFTANDSFDTGVMSNLVEALISSAESLRLRDRMADSIAEYVNVVDVHTANENLLSDILSDAINNFVLDFGCSGLTEEERQNAIAVCKRYGITSFGRGDKMHQTPVSEEQLTQMFHELSVHPNLMLPSFEDNYKRWMENMFISFTAHLNLPDYDREANQALQEIMSDIQPTGTTR